MLLDETLITVQGKGAAAPAMYLVTTACTSSGVYNSFVAEVTNFSTKVAFGKNKTFVVPGACGSAIYLHCSAKFPQKALLTIKFPFREPVVSITVFSFNFSDIMYLILKTN